MKTTDTFATWKCEKCGNTYSSSIEYCPNDGYSLQEGIKSILFEQLKEVKITRIDEVFPDNAHNSFHYQPYDEGVVSIHYIKSKNV
jgi:flagellar assembly factor FliW